MTTKLPEHLNPTKKSSNIGTQSPTERVWKWITTATAAVLLSACAAPHRNPDIITIQNMQYSSDLSVYERERALNRALEETRKERALIEERQRLDEKEARNRIQEYRDRQRLYRKTEQLHRENSWTIISAPAPIPAPASGKPISIYPSGK